MNSEVTLGVNSREEKRSAEATRGFEHALELFQRASVQVPAYRDFLRKNKVDPTAIRTPEDFALLPVVTKDNYLKKYPLNDLLWKEEGESMRIISTSSGSSGQPFFWPRGNLSVEESVEILDQLLSTAFGTRNRSTLCINAFAMGTWIAGTYMSSAMWRLADMGHKIVSVTPGINKDEILKILESLGREFDQVLLMGYPPFIKDAVDHAKSHKFNLKKLDIKCIFAGENFSENWRDYVLNRIGKKNKPESALGIYGTADDGIIGIESPLSVFLRRLALKDKALYSKLFGSSHILPSFVQYKPELRYIESPEDFIVFTADNSLPLIRYKILDEGRVLSVSDVELALAEANKSLPSSFKHYASDPFIALFGRQDVSAIFYALNIYPENIKYGLESHTLTDLVTGKFVVQSRFDDTTQEQSLHVNVELKQGVKPDNKVERKVFKAILSSLTFNNSEYNKLHQELGKKAEPIINLIPIGGQEFVIGAKQKWVRK